GWMTWHVDGVAVAGHSGGFAGFVTMIGFAPKEDLAAAVLTNANSPMAPRAVDLIYHVIAGVGRRWASAAATTRFHTRGSLAPYRGLFRYQGADLLVARVNGSLVMIDPEEADPLTRAARLEPRARDRFLIADGDDFEFLGEDVTFLRDRRGAVAGLRISGHVYDREDL
ncbi:MAG: serine hydrolase, partial [Acidobacteriota bacterium]|nr:serine hydrolase [Acidobacteriota bacterium]